MCLVPGHLSTWTFVSGAMLDHHLFVILNVTGFESSGVILVKINARGVVASADAANVHLNCCP